MLSPSSFSISSPLSTPYFSVLFSGFLLLGQCDVNTPTWQSAIRHESKKTTKDAPFLGEDTSGNIQSGVLTTVWFDILRLGLIERIQKSEILWKSILSRLSSLLIISSNNMILTRQKSVWELWELRAIRAGSTKMNPIVGARFPGGSVSFIKGHRVVEAKSCSSVIWGKLFNPPAPPVSYL